MIFSFSTLMRTLWSAPLRTALTLLGIAIGVASIVFLSALTKGAQAAMLDANQWATDSDVVRVDRAEAPATQATKASRPLSGDDGRAVASAGFAADDAVQTRSEKTFEADIDGRTKRVSLTSGNAGTLSMFRLEMDQGRPLLESDVSGAHRVAVVGSEVAKELFDGKLPPAGPRISVDGHLWTVVGILRHKAMMGTSTSTRIWDRRVLVPETAYATFYAPRGETDQLFVRARNREGMQAFRKVVESIIGHRHLGVQNFQLEQQDGAQQDTLVLTIVQILFLSTGLFSLFASGINVMNVMLVTVTERTREIGIRRAVGAKPRHVLVEFLAEAACLSGLGGLLGVVAGALGAWGLAALLTSVWTRWPLVLEAGPCVIAVALALLTGVSFGFLPAWRASKLLVTDALRSDGA